MENKELECLVSSLKDLPGINHSWRYRGSAHAYLRKEKVGEFLKCVDEKDWKVVSYDKVTKTLLIQSRDMEVKAELRQADQRLAYQTKPLQAREYERIQQLVAWDNDCKRNEEDYLRTPETVEREPEEARLSLYVGHETKHGLQGDIGEIGFVYKEDWRGERARIEGPDTGRYFTNLERVMKQASSPESQEWFQLKVDETALEDLQEVTRVIPDGVEAVYEQPKGVKRIGFSPCKPSPQTKMLRWL